MIETVRVSSKGQIVIPEIVRKKFDIREGTKLVLIQKGKKLVFEKEKDFILEIKKAEHAKEKMGWLHLAERSMKKVWDNPENEEVWSRYL